MWRKVAPAAAALILAGCAHKQHTVLPAVPVKIGHTETGIASWYGKPYDGRASASGEIYDMEAMVAAHRSMPFQTWVRVYNLSNKKTVDVRIIDRGPFVKHRIIDLSHAAAEAIDMVGPGITKVRLVVIRPQDAVVMARQKPTAEPMPATVPAVTPPVTTPAATPPALAATPSPPLPPPPPIYAVQVGVFRDRHSAEQLRKQMGTDFGIVQVMERASDPGLWRVYVGAEASEDAAGELAEQIRQKSGEKNAFVVRLDVQ